MAKTIEEKLRLWVERCGSQAEAARQLGVDRAFVHRMLNNGQSPGLRKAVELQRLTRGLPGGSIKPADWVE